MTDCEHFGKTIEELDMIWGLSGFLKYCANCLDSKKCMEASHNGK